MFISGVPDGLERLFDDDDLFALAGWLVGWFRGMFRTRFVTRTVLNKF